MKSKNFEVPTPTFRPAAPQRWPSVTSDVTVPFLQAAITGLVVALLFTIIVWGCFGYQLQEALDVSTIRGGFSTFAVTFAVSLTFAWFNRLGVITRTLHIVEEAIGYDLNRDGSIGTPTTVRIEIATERGQQIMDIEGLKGEDELRQFAILAATNRLTERNVKKAFNWPRESWQDTRDNLIHRGILQAGNGATAKATLSTEGQEIMRAILDAT